jgi:hypothetical protein
VGAKKNAKININDEPNIKNATGLDFTMTKTPEHFDKLGRLLAEGDCVAFPSSNSLCIGTISKLNPKMVKVKQLGATGYWARGSNKYPADLVKLDGEEVTMYLLKHAK